MSSLELVKKLAARGRQPERADDEEGELEQHAAERDRRDAVPAGRPDRRRRADEDAREAGRRSASLPNADNSTPLMAAAGLATRSPGEDAGTESEVLEAVQVALDLGADINAVDNNGETAMHAAAYKNLPKVVKFLAAKGARIDVWNRNDKFGWTPLAIAVGYRFGNFKPSAETEAAIREVMIAAGVTPPATIVATNR